MDSNSLSSLKFTDAREEQQSKAALPIVLVLKGSLIDTRASQPWNSCFGRCCMPWGRRIFLREWQLKKVRSPSSVTPEGMLILMRALQLLKQLYPIVLSDSGSTASLRMLQEENTPFSLPLFWSLTQLRRSTTPSATVTDSIFLLQRYLAASPLFQVT